MANLVQPGGWRAIGYSIRMVREADWLNLWRGMRSANTLGKLDLVAYLSTTLNTGPTCKQET